VLAQPAKPAPPKPKPHIGLFGHKLVARPKPGAKPALKPMAPASPMVGQIIGDKKTKVYHLPTDKGMLPAEKNRVYFKTERQAVAAGFRHAGQKAAPPKGSKMMPKGKMKMLKPHK
jgi:hypothetical protein